MTTVPAELANTGVRMAFTAVSVNAEIRRLVMITIEGMAGDGSVKARLRSAARKLGLSDRRIRGYYHGEVNLIEAHEAFQIIHQAQRAKREKLARMQHEYEALRLELANSAPSWLEILVPPAVARPDSAWADGGEAENG
jgi:hypothetical protein